MSLAALICAEKPTADGSAPLVAALHFAGHSLLEYQARQAVAAGAEHVLVMVGAVTPDLSRAIDRLGSDGVGVTLVRDIVSLSRALADVRALLLIADGALVAQSMMRAVADVGGAAVLAVLDGGPAAAMERIDAQHRWGGVAKLPVAELADTLDMLGDWDLQSTLLRRIVQVGADRIVAPTDAVLNGQVALLDSQRAADLLADAVMAARLAEVHEHGPVDQYLLSPLASIISPLLMRQHVPASQLDIGAAALATIGVLTVQLRLAGIGIALFLLAILLGRCADRLRRASARRSEMVWLPWVAPGLALLGLMLVGMNAPHLEISGYLGGLWLAALLAVLELTLLRKPQPSDGNADHWPMMCTISSALTLLLPLQWVGQIHWGIAIGTAWSIASLALVIQSRVR